MKGFTLVEIMVAVGIFALLGTAFTGFFISSLQAQRETLISQTMIDNISYNLEYISRSIRMAKKDMDGDCIGQKENYQFTPGNSGIEFLNYQGNCQSFFLENGRIREKKDDVENYLTPTDLTVNSFIIEGSETWSQEDETQPIVRIFLEIEGIKFQTSISQRNLNVMY